MGRATYWDCRICPYELIAYFLLFVTWLLIIISLHILLELSVEILWQSSNRSANSVKTGLLIPGYTLSYIQKDDAERNAIVIDLSSDSLNHTISGLHPTTVYTVSLYASTRVGSGPERTDDVQTSRTPGMLHYLLSSKLLHSSRGWKMASKKTRFLFFLKTSKVQI